MLLLTPLTPYLWAQRTAPGQLEIGGLNSGTTMHQVQSKKKKKRQYCHLGQQFTLWSIISTNHMTPLCDHPVIHSASTNRHAAWRKGRAGLWE